MLLQSEGLKGAKFKIMTFFSLKCVPILFSLCALSSKIRAEDPQIYYGKASQTWTQCSLFFNFTIIFSPCKGALKKMIILYRLDWMNSPIRSLKATNWLSNFKKTHFKSQTKITLIEHCANLKKTMKWRAAKCLKVLALID